MTTMRVLVAAVLSVVARTQALLGQADILQREVVLRPNPAVSISVTSNVAYKSAVPGAVMDVYTPADAAGRS